jgi:hypothetical protein
MVTISLPKNTRYKDTSVFSEVVYNNTSFGLWQPPTEFQSPDNSWNIYTVTRADVGFLDRVAFLTYGDGYEFMWWAIAQANKILDPEVDMYVGQSLTIPPLQTVLTFVARAPVNA